MDGRLQEERRSKRLGVGVVLRGGALAGGISEAAGALGLAGQRLQQGTWGGGAGAFSSGCCTLAPQANNSCTVRFSPLRAARWRGV